MRDEEWPYVLSLVQGIINERVSDKGHSAKEIFMGLEQFDPVHLILASDGVQQSTVRRARVTTAAIEAELALLHERLEDIHRNVRQSRENLRDMEVRTRDNQLLRLSRHRHRNSTELTRHI